MLYWSIIPLVLFIYEKQFMKSNLWRLIRLVSSVGLPRLGPQTACFDSFWRRQRWWWWWFGKMMVRFIPCCVPPNVFPITAEETDSLVWFFGWENWRPAWKERWAAHADPHYLSIRVSPTTWLDKISFQHKKKQKAPCTLHSPSVSIIWAVRLGVDYCAFEGGAQCWGVYWEHKLTDGLLWPATTAAPVMTYIKWQLRRHLSCGAFQELQMSLL